MTGRTRRSFLVALGASTALAGCSGGENGDPASNDPQHTTERPSTSTTTARTTTPRTTTPSTTTTPSPDRPGTVISDFESLDRWGAKLGRGSLSADTETVAHGSQSAHLTADGTSDVGGAYRVFSEPRDFSGKTFSLAVRVTTPTVTKVLLKLIAPNRENVLMHARVLPGPTDRWVRVDFCPTYRENLPDLSQVSEIQILCRRRNGGQTPIGVHLDDLRTRQRPESGVAVLTFDGMHESQYRTAFEVMEEFGYAGVMGAMPRVLGDDGRLDLPELHTLRDAGWDVASRPATAGDFWPDLSVEKQRSLVTTTKQYLVNKGFEAGARHFIATKDVIGPNTLDIVSEHHEQAFRFGGAPTGLPVTDRYNIGRFSGTAGETTRNRIDLAADYSSLAVLQFSAFGDGGMDRGAFRELLQYVEDADVEVRTASELLDRA